METEVIEELSKMLHGRGVVSIEEIERKAIRAALRSLGESALKVDKEFISTIISSFIECPISFKSLHFSEEVELNGVKFYHMHTYKPKAEDFEEAFREYEISKLYLERLNEMIGITDRFFNGYTASGYVLREYKRDKYRYLVFYSTIDDVCNDIEYHLKLSESINGEYVVVVTTESSCRPFYKFYKNFSEDVKKANMKIWVANTYSRTIDPFIGYPKDFTLLKGFKNPKLASIIGSYWRVKVEKID